MVGWMAYLLLVLILLCGLAAGGVWVLWRVLRAPRPLRRAGLGALLGGLGFAVADGLLLLGLPRLGVSFGPPGLSLAALLLARAALYLAWALPWARRYPPANPHLPRSLHAGRSIFLLLNLALTAAVADAFYLEPLSLRVSRVQVQRQAAQSAPRSRSAAISSSAGGGSSAADFAPFTLPDGRHRQRSAAIPSSAPDACHRERSAAISLRILHLSDLHVERLTPRERRLTAQAAALQPDLILLSGDYLNTSSLRDPAALAAARELIGRLRARYGVYAVAGNVDDARVMAALFAGLSVRVLQNEVIAPPGLPGVALIGLSCCAREEDGKTLRRLASRAPPGTYRILLYHTPDLAEEAAAAGVDLYLAGHTHGGQIRLPLYGALYTSSAYGKRFEMGAYRLGGMTLYVNRGVGLEGGLAPRARFLCPPEAALVEVE